MFEIIDQDGAVVAEVESIDDAQLAAYTIAREEEWGNCPPLRVLDERGEVVSVLFLVPPRRRRSAG